ncbi:MAG: calcium-binding protein [Alphaproteobacteria bacterium]|nr:MAG: calcium-binding protein [Alphaproteobacteria bacterium]
MQGSFQASPNRGRPFAPDRAQADLDPTSDYVFEGHGQHHHPAALRPAFVPEAQDGGMAVMALGNADAIGHDSFSDAAVEIRLYQRGIVSLVLGTMTFTAYAASGPDEIAYATADTPVEAPGADIFIARTVHATGSGETDAGSWSIASSTTTFFAMDVLHFGLAGGPLISILTKEITLDAVDASVSGNLATFAVETQAFGDNTLNDVAVSAFALDNQLSTVSVQVTMAGSPAASDGFRFGTACDDRIITGSGSDAAWIFGGAGADTIVAGAGDNTLFGNEGNDRLQAGDGQDWVFGGAGHDRLLLGGGNNIGFGGDGNDTIQGADDDDWIDAGSGNDLVQVGGGRNTLRMGGAGHAGDGNDLYVGGAGADWYLLDGAFGSDRIVGFNLAQGDRLVAHAGDWESVAGLNALNGDAVWLSRGLQDARDLIVTMAIDGGISSVNLDDFFSLNAGFSAQGSGKLGDAAALPLLQAIFEDADLSAEAADRAAAFAPADFLTMFA